MKNWQIMCYTREPQEEAIYSSKLAYSMHLGIKEAGEADYIPLNHNTGILYAKGVQSKTDGTISAKTLKNPRIFRLSDGSFGVLAVRVEADGADDESSRGCVLYVTSKDLVTYQECGLLVLAPGKTIEQVNCIWEEASGQYVLTWLDSEGSCGQGKTQSLEELLAQNAEERKATKLVQTEAIKTFEKRKLQTQIEGAYPGNCLWVSEAEGDYLRKKLIVATHVANEMPENITVSSLEELEKIKVKSIYSDGTSCRKRIDWYAQKVDFSRPGKVEVKGRIHQDHFTFPIAWDRADPCMGRWEGKYYFIATNDADDNHSLYIREADSIPQLITAQEVKILDASMYPHLGNLLWAPEFHIIKGRLYIFHAGTPQEFHKEQCHVMALKPGGNPMLASDWEMPVRVVRKDGSALFVPGITLDMTVFTGAGSYYVIWSQRQFEPVDQGAWLMIAQIDPEQPWRLITDPVVLAIPEYGWDNNHVFVDEGPYALITDQKVFITFSGALIDSTYCVGLISADLDADFLNPQSWTRGNYPILTSASCPGEYGTGHNAYIKDDEGLIWNTYHGRPGITAPRSSGVRRVHFDIDGYPVLEMTEDRDLNQELTQIRVEIEIV